jgi:UDP-galactopyranose mutase
LARAVEGKVWFAGRLGDYAYYNMDQACARALALFEKRIAPAVCSQAAE